VCGSVRARAAIQSWSPQTWSVPATTDEVAGGVSAARAIGSALSRRTPSAPVISNLYRVPGPTSGTKSSHTPLEPSDRIGWPAPSQWFRSPTSRTPRACGAQTANEVPRTGPIFES
jgi:hypothetical protein